MFWDHRVGPDRLPSLIFCSFSCTSACSGLDPVVEGEDVALLAAPRVAQLVGQRELVDHPQWLQARDPLRAVVVAVALVLG